MTGNMATTQESRELAASLPELATSIEPAKPMHLPGACQHRIGPDKRRISHRTPPHCHPKPSSALQLTPSPIPPWFPFVGTRVMMLTAQW
jgi:hypothetical protein